MKQFKIQNSYLLRMIEDGIDVVLTDEFRAKLYMSADEDTAAAAVFDGDGGDSSATNTGILAKKKGDPTYGMTMQQRERYLKRKNAKPRPRDIFDAQAIVMA